MESWGYDLCGGGFDFGILPPSQNSTGPHSIVVWSLQTTTCSTLTDDPSNPEPSNTNPLPAIIPLPFQSGCFLHTPSVCPQDQPSMKSTVLRHPQLQRKASRVWRRQGAHNLWDAGRSELGDETARIPTSSQCASIIHEMYLRH